MLREFGAGRLTARISELEAGIARGSGRNSATAVQAAGVTARLLESAFIMKRASAQIDVVIHALGISLLLPRLLERGERVQYVSLGAGNTGRAFDLETNRRIAEFKFIEWQGGSETIRQNSLFKDFYLLAEARTGKRKHLYVLGLDRPMKFLRGKRALKSVLSKSVALWTDFQQRYGGQYERVGAYFALKEEEVLIEDILPELQKVLRDSA
jgi:hypothetical protein